jgi:hypothetical protein
MQTYKIKVSFKLIGSMSTREETHEMKISALDVNRIREWLANHYKVGPHDVSVYNYSEI